MHEHDAPSDSVVAKWAMRIAIVVFAGLGILELVVATAFHKVALGVDGAHNLVDAIVFSINLRAQSWVNLDEFSFWTCVGEPGAPLFASGLVVTGAIAFTAYESIVGGGSETHQSLALLLLTISLVANGTFAGVMYWDRQRRQKRQQVHNRHQHNALVHAFWDMVSALSGALAYVLIIQGLPNALDPILAWVGATLILIGHRDEITESWQEVVFHRDPEHSHESHDPNGSHESDHTP